MAAIRGPQRILLRTESEHDCYGAGLAARRFPLVSHAVGRDLRGGDENIVVIAGDAAFTCGISYEALNNGQNAYQAFHRRAQRTTSGRSQKTWARS